MRSCGWLMFVLALHAAPVPAAPPVDFGREIKPLLSAHCVKCHGATKQEGGLRLDRRSDALRGGDSYAPAIVPGKAATSPLWQFVADPQADLHMPPQGPRLPQAEADRLRRWIDEGAAWPVESAPPDDPSSRHWAFQPLRRPQVPTVAGDEPLGPVDAFLAARLAQAGLAFSPPADKQALIRRVAFDLVGLPPTPEEAAEFVADTRPDAYERLVQRLLASPRHGERWARHWLDVVRFAESHGFEMNQMRPSAWRYRDYVIEAFNSDKPYDQFIREQLAGDQLGAGAATGFLVAGAWDQVKSPDPALTAQQRADELHDMVSITGSAFLGLTIGCARCHSHKFDPIPQADYYAVKACLEGVQHGERPLPMSSSAEQQRELAQWEAKLRELDQALADYEPLADPRGLVWLGVDGPSFRPLKPAMSVALDPTAERGGAAFAGSAVQAPTLSKGFRAWRAEAGEAVALWSKLPAGKQRIRLSWGCGVAGQARDARYLLDADGDLATTSDQTEIARVDQRQFAQPADAPPDKPVWSGFFDAGVHTLSPSAALVLRTGAAEGDVTADLVVLQAAEGERLPARLALRPPVSRGRCSDRFAPVLARQLRFTVLAVNNGAEPCLDELEIYTTAETGGRNVALAAAGAKATASGTYPASTLHQLEHVNDGRYGNERSWISHERGRGWVQIELPREEQLERIVWSRDRGQPPKYADRVATQYRVEVSRDGVHWQTVAAHHGRLPPEASAPAGALFVAPAAAGGATLAELLAERESAENQRHRLLTPPAMAYAGKFVAPPPTRRFHRGDPTQPREDVAPGALTQIGPPAKIAAGATEAERRLQLAAWIASPENPLTARVIVNRLWQHHFGEGLVATPSDFGAGGGQPSHPELLDWLASELVAPTLDPQAKPWSLRRIHRLICTSRAYRQSSQANPQGIARDAATRLLWRYPPRRVEAEPLRDAVLAVSGALDLRAGGPGFDLFEPNSNYVKVYTPKKSFGPDDFRRLIYWSKPRMRLEDTFGPFDCPDAGQTAPKRGASITPLQALSLLNSPFLVQQSERFAARIQQEAAGDAERLARAFQLAFQRKPAADEAAAGLALARAHGWPAVCRALFNASEFLELP